MMSKETRELPSHIQGLDTANSAFNPFLIVAAHLKKRYDLTTITFTYKKEATPQDPAATAMVAGSEGDFARYLQAMSEFSKDASYRILARAYDGSPSLLENRIQGVWQDISQEDHDLLMSVAHLQYDYVRGRKPLSDISFREGGQYGPYTPYRILARRFTDLVTRRFDEIASKSATLKNLLSVL